MCSNPSINNNIGFGVGYRDLTKYARKIGCEILRQGKGSHEIWCRTINGQKLKAPLPARKDIPEGTARSFCKMLGMPVYA